MISRIPNTEFHFYEPRYSVIFQVADYGSELKVTELKIINRYGGPRSKKCDLDRVTFCVFVPPYWILYR